MTDEHDIWEVSIQNVDYQPWISSYWDSVLGNLLEEGWEPFGFAIDSRTGEWKIALRRRISSKQLAKRKGDDG